MCVTPRMFSVGLYLFLRDELASLREQYRQLRKRIYRSMRRDRRLWADAIADQAQNAANMGNLKKMYNMTKNCRDKRGKLITTAEEQLERCREHFEEVFRTSATDIDSNPLSKIEVEKALRFLKKRQGACLENAKSRYTDRRRVTNTALGESMG
ncbi:unnamed protein product [Euphydryas editha]|uniref:Uncharacterized protein n=1 Tax=Euphydryas editha TaxID=104508 RepID=A0AAU9UZ74_EUPED|nr:unnamed protein product [Euphydryas editha]